MAFQPVTDAASCVVRGTLNSGQVIENVFHVNLVGTLDQTLADNFTTDLATAYGELLGAVNTGVTFADVLVTDLRTDPAPQFVSVAGAFPMVGTDAVEQLPDQIAALISWRTDQRGKSFRGRTYLGGFCEDHSSGRNVSATLQEALQDFVEDMTTGATHFWGVVSRFHGVDPVTHKPIPRAAGIFTPFTTGTVRPTWVTQRRRGR